MTPQEEMITRVMGDPMYEAAMEDTHLRTLMWFSMQELGTVEAMGMLRIAWCLGHMAAQNDVPAAFLEANDAHQDLEVR